jgi:hypothetical protein
MAEDLKMEDIYKDLKVSLVFITTDNEYDL